MEAGEADRNIVEFGFEGEKETVWLWREKWGALKLRPRPLHDPSSTSPNPLPLNTPMEGHP